MTDKREEVKNYLDYLDKEMTIMGILSTFCVLSFGGAMDKIVFYEKEKVSTYVFWLQTHVYCLVGLITIMLAALYFYRQRSLLAYYNGQISLGIAKNDRGRIDEGLDYADAWRTWEFYRIAWGFLIVSSVNFTMMLLAEKFEFFRSYEYPACLISSIIVFSFIIFEIHACRKYKEEDDPIARSMELFWQRFKK